MLFRFITRSLFMYAFNIFSLSVYIVQEWLSCKGHKVTYGSPVSMGLNSAFPFSVAPEHLKSQAWPFFFFAVQLTVFYFKMMLFFFLEGKVNSNFRPLHKGASPWDNQPLSSPDKQEKLLLVFFLQFSQWAKTALEDIMVLLTRKPFSVLGQISKSSHL